MPQASTTVRMDHRGRLTAPEESREKLGLGEMDTGEKVLVDLDIVYVPPQHGDPYE